MWIYVYIWTYTHGHIYLMKPWALLWKNVHADIFSFIRLSFSILIIQVPLGIVKVCTCDFTLQLASVPMLDQTNSLSRPLHPFLWWCVGLIVSASLCAKIGAVSGIPEGPPEHYRWSLWGRMGRPDGTQIMCFSFITLHPPSSTQQIFLLYLLSLFLCLFRLYPWFSRSIALSMSGACPRVTAEPCTA